MPRIAPLPAGIQRPFWSVMIPSYNSAVLLEQTIESVLVQAPGPEDMQIEVVDDASTTDDPGDVVARCGNGRVGLFRQAHNVGAPRNFTTCVRRASGRWVHVLHSDDFVMPGFYDAYRRRIEDCPDVVMVAAQTIATDIAGHHLGLTALLVAAEGRVRDAPFVIAAVNPLRFVSVVVSRNAYERVGGFHPELAHANDWEMWSRLAASGPVGWVDHPFGMHRSHPGSDTTRLHHASTGYIDDCRRAAEMIASHFEHPDLQARARRAALRVVGDYALGVGMSLVAGGRVRLGLANAARAVRVDPSVHSISRAAEIAQMAIGKLIEAHRSTA